MWLITERSGITLINVDRALFQPFYLCSLLFPALVFERLSRMLQIVHLLERKQSGGFKPVTHGFNAKARSIVRLKFYKFTVSYRSQSK
jgi:hypothetical protein